jgi:lipoprotein-anchoring transpeptidase ErfK/SrfK
VRILSTRARPGRTTSPYGSRRVTAGALAAAALLIAGCGKSHAASPSGGQPTSLAKLPQATTFTTLAGLPRDTATATAGDGTVVHPTTTVAVSAAPGGLPMAALPSTELGGPTWVPVVATKPGWRQVLLPSKPNNTAGWIAAGGLQSAHSPYVIKVGVSARRLTLLKSGKALGTWTVAVGAAKTPTPVGRTFVLASLAPANATYSPLILPVGAHSATLDTFGGGPGTVALHGWPQKSVFGKAVTHGCVRVPSDALTRLAKVPLGTTVLVTA